MREISRKFHAIIMEVAKGIMSPDKLSKQIEELVGIAFSEIHKTSKFICGETPIPATGKVFGTPELESAVRASLDFWLTAGPYTEEFENRLARSRNASCTHGEFRKLG